MAEWTPLDDNRLVIGPTGPTGPRGIRGRKGSCSCDEMVFHFQPDGKRFIIDELKLGKNYRYHVSIILSGNSNTIISLTNGDELMIKHTIGQSESKTLTSSGEYVPTSHEFLLEGNYSFTRGCIFFREV